jgi:hypothetical protein
VDVLGPDDVSQLIQVHGIFLSGLFLDLACSDWVDGNPMLPERPRIAKPSTAEIGSPIEVDSNPEKE